MVWAPDLDDFSGSFCNQGKYPLLKSMNDAWFSDALFTWVICQLEISLPFIENKNFAELKISVMYDKFGSLFSLHFEYYALFYSFIKKNVISIVLDLQALQRLQSLLLKLFLQWQPQTFHLKVQWVLKTNFKIYLRISKSIVDPKFT